MQAYLTQLTRSALNPGHNGQTPKETPTMQTTIQLNAERSNRVMRRIGVETWRLSIVALAAVCIGLGAMTAQGVEAYWTGVNGANWSGDGEGGQNWSSTAASPGVPYTPVNGDGLRWFFSGTANLTSFNDFESLSVVSIGFGANPGPVVLNGNKLTVTGTIGGGTNPAKATFNLPLELNAATVTIGGSSSDDITLNGVITEFGGSRNLLLNAGKIALNAANSFSGNVELGFVSFSPTVTINTLANSGVKQSLGIGDLIIFGFRAQTGTLVYTGTATSTDKKFRIGTQSGSPTTGGGAFLNNGSGHVVWTGAQTLDTAATVARSFNLGGTNTDDNEWQSMIGDNSANGTIGILKTGAGKWILSGDNTYTGATTVSGGTLLINGNQSAATGQVTVSADAAIGGNGTIGGSLTLANDAKFWFDPSYTLTVNGGTVDLGNLGIADILNLSATTPDGLYTLLAGSFSIIGGENWGLANAYDFGVDKKIAYFESGSLVLVVATIPEPASAALLALAGLAALRRRR